MSVSDPHDKYFRSVMQIIVIARQFLQWFLPKQVSNILDFDSLKPFDGTYIEGDLSKTMSDVVFDCRYKTKGHDSRLTQKYQHSKIVILIEHQSTPDKFMPIRVFNYLFNLLNKHMQSDDFKHDDSSQLPAIYPMVFYHGKRKHYPYSMKVIDCIENPANIMHQFAALKVQLININELPQRIRLDFVSGANQNLNRLLDEPGRGDYDTVENSFFVFNPGGWLVGTTSQPPGS